MPSNHIHLNHSLVIEQLTSHDIQDIVNLSTLLGWDYSAEEIHLILETGFLFGHRNHRGKVISTAAIFPYKKNFASLGVVMVDPDFRRRGLATQLVQKCMETVSGIPIMLIATEEGKPLYEKLGFKTAGTLYKLIAQKYKGTQTVHVDDYTIHSLTDAHMKAILKLDQQAFGADRGTFLKKRIKQATLRAVLLNQSKEVAGYALGVQTPELLIIGPVIAPNSLAASLLVQHIASRHPGPMRIDIPSEHPSLSDFLISNGFEIVRQPPVMTYHFDHFPNRPHLFALAAQAYG
ncbi:GNAT family N-acetyltransferase [Thermoflavimicrobium dichotomicum]|uniref:Predicted acetyltransferase n=1 Tax=Thermoflavimicrobium dichotomicum TaxID=46223 RepID=A0A1I3PXU6_9BACL|nr:GNAT family N-acetyltransferase [Thermoflavimicrobium dichotomicum]SFJ26260.1 Predicted acetyltransferase [Thermoflavimicrobium dichotomicum]